MSAHWSEILAGGTAVASAVAAVASWVVAVRANKVAEEANSAADRANQAADAANRTADAVSRIEHDRWHAELTPQFEITATRLGPGVDRASLRLALTGPTGLPGLSHVVLRIRNDGYSHQPLGMVTQEMLDATIFGPCRFEPGIDNASQDGRTVTTRPIGLGDWDKVSLGESLVPSWSSRDYWEARYANEPVRLSLECHAEGHRPWYIARDVSLEDPADERA